MSDYKKNRVPGEGFVYNSVKSLSEEFYRRIEQAKKLNIKMEHGDMYEGLNIDGKYADGFSNDARFPQEETSSYYSEDAHRYDEDDSGEINITDEDVGIYKRNRDAGISIRKVVALIIVGAFIFFVMFGK